MHPIPFSLNSHSIHFNGVRELVIKNEHNTVVYSRNLENVTTLYVDSGVFYVIEGSHSDTPDGTGDLKIIGSCESWSFDAVKLELIGVEDFRFGTDPITVHTFEMVKDDLSSRTKVEIQNFIPDQGEENKRSRSIYRMNKKEDVVTSGLPDCP